MVILKVIKQILLLIWNQELKWQIKYLKVVNQVPVDFLIGSSEVINISLLDSLVVQINHEMFLN